MNAAIAVLRGSNVDDGAFMLTRLSVLSGSCRCSGARQSLDIPSECANDLRMAAGFYGYGRSRRREQYIRVGQAAEEWFVLFPNYFLKSVLLRLFVVQETHNSSLHFV